VAIEIQSPAREVLEEARSRFEPGFGEMPPHVTILAPIDVDADAMPAVVRHLSEVASATPPFRLELTGAETFRPVTSVVFVGIGAGADSCIELESRVRSGDMAVELRFPYHPHVTIAHDVADDVLDSALEQLSAFESAQVADRMALYECIDGRWTPVQEFPFGG
jgi:2'-5' RNA ligase